MDRKRRKVVYRLHKGDSIRD